MEYNKELIKEYLLTTSSAVINQGNKYIIKVDGKQMEIGKCRLSSEIDIIGCYDIVYYIKFNGEYIYIDKEDFSTERVVNFIYHRIDKESIISFKIEQEEEKIINNVDAISNNVLLDIIHRNTKIKGINYELNKRISKSELYYMLKHIHPYYENTYPFKISIGTDTYEIGIGEIEKEDIYFYIEKNKVIEYLKELEYIDHEEIIIILDYLLLDTKEEIVLHLNNECMNGKEKRITNLSDAIIDYILYSGTHLSTKE
jgi:hypothetical protein